MLCFLLTLTDEWYENSGRPQSFVHHLHRRHPSYWYVTFCHFLKFIENVFALQVSSQLGFVCWIQRLSFERTGRLLMGNSRRWIGDPKWIPSLNECVLLGKSFGAQWLLQFLASFQFKSPVCASTVQPMVYCQCQLSAVLCFAVDLLTGAAEMFLGLKQ